MAIELHPRHLHVSISAKYGGSPESADTNLYGGYHNGHPRGTPTYKVHTLSRAQPSRHMPISTFWEHREKLRHGIMYIAR